LVKARVRGIYSTALTKLLLDHGFEIVQPSNTLQQRLRLESREEAPELDVYDRPDLQGVHLLGEAEALEAFLSILRSLLVDVIVRRWGVFPDGIYKGLVIRKGPSASSVLIDVGSATGEIANEGIRDPELRNVVVQVEGRRAGTEEPLFTTKIKMPGRYAVLIPGRQIKVSRKIRDRKARSKLHDLGEELAPAGWGVLWRTAAATQPSDVLRREVVNLAKEGQAVLQKAERVEAPFTLWGKKRFADVEFPALSKKGLDEVRRAVAPTIDGHHYYKACGGRVSSALEMAEKLLEKGSPEGEVKALLEQTIGAEYPIAGSLIKVEHVKLDGSMFQLGPAQVEAFDGGSSPMRFRRVFHGKGVYDGLGTRKEPGDWAVTEVRVGEWHLRTRYFSRGGRYKGMYVNLSTPVELYPHGIRYVDLEVDLCVWPDGRVRKLDEEKLERAAAEGLVTEKLADIVAEKTQELMKGFLR